MVSSAAFYKVSLDHVGQTKG